MKTYNKQGRNIQMYGNTYSFYIEDYCPKCFLIILQDENGNRVDSEYFVEDYLRTMWHDLEKNPTENIVLFQNT